MRPDVLQSSLPGILLLTGILAENAVKLVQLNGDNQSIRSEYKHLRAAYFAGTPEFLKLGETENFATDLRGEKEIDKPVTLIFKGYVRVIYSDPPTSSGECEFQNCADFDITMATNDRRILEFTGNVVLHIQDKPTIIESDSDAEMEKLHDEIGTAKTTFETESDDLDVYITGAARFIYLKPARKLKHANRPTGPHFRGDVAPDDGYLGENSPSFAPYDYSIEKHIVVVMTGRYQIRPDPQNSIGNCLNKRLIGHQLCDSTDNLLHSLKTQTGGYRHCVYRYVKNSDAQVELWFNRNAPEQIDDEAIFTMIDTTLKARPILTLNNGAFDFESPILLSMLLNEKSNRTIGPYASRNSQLRIS